MRHALHRLPALQRGLAVLLACLALAGATLAAAGGRTPRRLDPGQAVVNAALQHLRQGYAWGAAGPKQWDCSGLTSRLWREVGGVTRIPRTSSQQQAWAVPLPEEQVIPGDLVFFGDPVTHVGIIRSRTKTKTGSTLQMIDASSSQKGVVARDVWTSGTVRFGRVPRSHMIPVRPWTPPPAPVVAPPPQEPPLTLPPEAVARSVPGHTPLRGFAAVQAGPSSPVARKAARLARGLLGNTTLSDVALVRIAWRKAGGAILPTTRAGLVAAGRAVGLRGARVGDVVVFDTSHVGIYVGRGLMIDASRSLGKVVWRPVWTSPSVRVLRFAR